jgi:hypothetical protein
MANTTLVVLFPSLPRDVACYANCCWSPVTVQILKGGKQSIQRKLSINGCVNVGIRSEMVVSDVK